MARSLEDRIPEIVAELEPAVDAAVKAALELVIESARTLLMSTGWDVEKLAESIHIEPALEGWYVVAGDKEQWYGHLIEYGTIDRHTHNEIGLRGHPAGRMPARPFLLPALEANREAIVEAVRAAVSKVA